MDKVKNGGFSAFNGASLSEKPKSESVSSLDGMSDSEGGTSDMDGLAGDSTNHSSGSAPREDSFGPPIKRLKQSDTSSQLSH